MKPSKSALHKKRNLTAIASYLEVSEQKINRLHSQFIRSLEGKRFSHKKFIDFLWFELYMKDGN